MKGDRLDSIREAAMKSADAYLRKARYPTTEREPFRLGFMRGYQAGAVAHERKKPKKPALLPTMLGTITQCAICNTQWTANEILPCPNGCRIPDAGAAP